MSLDSTWLTDIQKVGVGLSGFGVFFMLVGCLMLFDRGLLALGNLMFISGLIMVVGVRRTVSFFLRPRKWRGSLAFVSGLLLVLFKKPMIGMVVEVFGLVNLFGYC